MIPLLPQRYNDRGACWIEVLISIYGCAFVPFHGSRMYILTDSSGAKAYRKRFQEALGGRKRSSMIVLNSVAALS